MFNKPKEKKKRVKSKEPKQLKPMEYVAGWLKTLKSSVSKQSQAAKGGEVDLSIQKQNIDAALAQANDIKKMLEEEKRSEYEKFINPLAGIKRDLGSIKEGLPKKQEELKKKQVDLQAFLDGNKEVLQNKKTELAKTPKGTARDKLEKWIKDNAKTTDKLTKERDKLSKEVDSLIKTQNALTKELEAKQPLAKKQERLAAIKDLLAKLPNDSEEKKALTKEQASLMADFKKDYVAKFAKPSQEIDGLIKDLSTKSAQLASAISDKSEKTAIASAIGPTKWLETVLDNRYSGNLDKFLQDNKQPIIQLNQMGNAANDLIKNDVKATHVPDMRDMKATLAKLDKDLMESPEWKEFWDKQRQKEPIPKTKGDIRDRNELIKTQQIQVLDSYRSSVTTEWSKNFPANATMMDKALNEVRQEQQAKIKPISDNYDPSFLAGQYIPVKSEKAQPTNADMAAKLSALGDTYVLKEKSGAGEPTHLMTNEANLEKTKSNEKNNAEKKKRADAKTNEIELTPLKEKSPKLKGNRPT